MGGGWVEIIKLKTKLSSTGAGLLAGTELGKIIDHITRHKLGGGEGSVEVQQKTQVTQFFSF